MSKSIDQQIVIYQTDDGKIELEIALAEETVWLSQMQICDLFDKNKRTISEHIRNIFKEGELQENSVVRKSRTTAADGKSYEVNQYNLDVIISVGYRVKSQRGTQFRIWANNILKQYLIQGYALNEQKLREQQEKLHDLQQAIVLSSRLIHNKDPVNQRIARHFGDTGKIQPCLDSISMTTTINA